MERHENGMNGSLNGDANGHEPKMLSLEIEVADDHEEQQSLLMETSGEAIGGDKKKQFMGRNSHGMRRRQWGTDDGIVAKGSGAANSMGSSMIQGFVRGDLLSHAVYHLRNALVLGVLAFFVLLVLDWEGGVMRSETMEEQEKVSPHMWSYGGKFNRNHDLEPYKKRAPLSAVEELDLEEEILDEATERVGTWDLAIENKMNEEAHYLHDPEKSPFASNLYNADDPELDERQRTFAKRMGEIVEKFGVWNNPDYEDWFGADDDFFEEYYYRDVPIDDFPFEVWQTDESYIKQFLDEAQSLIEATKEGIMQEYNHPNPNDEEKDMFGVIIGDEHEFINGTAHHSETKKRLPGVAYLPEKAWQGLIRKLLHAMVTNDHFYVVVTGTEKTYKANNFAKSQVMQFNYIMEPIFHKLGMKLTSRNMGMSASTAFAALGGADILGETDILWHIQSPEEEEREGEFDLLQKQAIMSGERVPIILSAEWEELMQASKGKAWVGNIQPGVDFCQPTTMDVLPDAPACHGVHCDEEAWESGKCHVYDSVCWELRSDWNPDSQADNVGDQDAGFPGYRRHQLEGRKMTLLLLHALNSAIEQWRANIEDDRAPLPLSTDLWHVGGFYENIRESVMSLERTPGEIAGVPPCEKLLKDVDARICHVPMHTYTEWTPRVIPRTTGLVSIINNMVLGVEEEEEIYDGPDIVPLSWGLPNDETDVHMIAIAANVTPGYDDDLFGGQYLDDDWIFAADDWIEGIDGDDDGDAEADDDGDDDSTRHLRQGERTLKKRKQNQEEEAKKAEAEKKAAEEAAEAKKVEEEAAAAKKAEEEVAAKKTLEEAAAKKAEPDSDKRKGKKKGRGRGKNTKNPKDKEDADAKKAEEEAAAAAAAAAANAAEEAAAKAASEAAQAAKNNKKKGKDKGSDKNKKTPSTPPPTLRPTEAPLQVYAGERLEIAEGSGWQLQDAPVGFCDGSAQSRCNRNIDNMCLLANHNHYKGSVVGGPKNNWLTMRVPEVKHGIVLARMTLESSDGSTRLPSDLLFDYAVNGIVNTVKGSDLKNFGKEIVRGLTVFPLVNGRDAVVDGEDFGTNFDIAIRLRSFVDPNCSVKLSHIYFA